MITSSSSALCSLLGCRFPVISAGMGGPARSDLVSAVSAAGGFGFLGMVRETADLIRREVEAVRRTGHERFGVNLIPAATPPDLLLQQVEVCLELSVPVVGMFWDIDPTIVATLKAAGTVVVWQVGSVDEAISAERAGVDVLIVQGREAGGHVRGTQRLGELLPQVTEAVRIPVLAAGGMATGADLLVASALGAAGGVFGTAFLATEESFAHDYHKQRLIEAVAGDTVLTNAYHINWPLGAAVRVIKSPITRGEFNEGEEAEIGRDTGRPIVRYSTDSPLRSTTGALEQMALYAGTGVTSLRSIMSAGDTLRAIVGEAMSLLEPPATEPASPVCYLPPEQHPETASEIKRVAVEVERIATLARGALRAQIAERPDTMQTGEAPFDAKARDYAAWALRLGGSSIGHGDGPTGRRAELAHIEASLMEQLRHMLPSMAQNELRDQLSALESFIAADTRKHDPV